MIKDSLEIERAMAKDYEIVTEDPYDAEKLITSYKFHCLYVDSHSAKNLKEQVAGLSPAIIFSMKVSEIDLSIDGYDAYDAYDSGMVIWTKKNSRISIEFRSIQFESTKNRAAKVDLNQASDRQLRPRSQHAPIAAAAAAGGTTAFAGATALTAAIAEPSSKSTKNRAAKVDFRQASDRQLRPRRQHAPIAKVATAAAAEGTTALAGATALTAAIFGPAKVDAPMAAFAATATALTAAIFGSAAGISTPAVIAGAVIATGVAFRVTELEPRVVGDTVVHSTESRQDHAGITSRGNPKNVSFVELTFESESYFIFALYLKGKSLVASRKLIEERIRIAKKDEVHIRFLICVTVHSSEHKELVLSVAESLNLICHSIQNPSFNLISNFSVHIRKVSDNGIFLYQPDKVLTFWGKKDRRKMMEEIREENKFLREKMSRIKKAKDKDEELKIWKI